MTDNNSKVLDLIKTTIKAAEPTATIMLYGSRARGDNRPDSDWDILVLVDGEKVSNHQFEALNYNLWLKGLDLDADINVMIRTKKEWNRPVPSPFRKNVSKDSIQL